MIKDIISILTDRPMKKSVNGRYFSTYLKEVTEDIRVLRYFMHYPKFEREQEPIFEYFIEKYKKEYCPSRLYGYFSE